MKTTGNKFNSTFSKFFDKNEIQAIKDTIRFGSWGDVEMTFADGKDAYSWGFCTNDCHKGGHFKGREVTKIWSSIARKIRKTEAGLFLQHANDWWGDGTGDMMFVRLDGFFDGDYDDLIAWARDKKKVQPTAQERLENYTKELQEREALIEQDMKSDEVKANHKRIASLKRKIARAEKSLKNADEK